jgi:hypothetical protein
MKKAFKKVHRKGEKIKTEVGQLSSRVAIDTYAGRVHIDWDETARVTPFGQLAFFIEFLKRTELFDEFVKECPLELTSPNAPETRDVLGTILLSVLAGHTRYSHITALRADKVSAELLGMTKTASEDSVRRNLEKIPPDLGRTWQRNALKNCYLELLDAPWILDVDTTVKCLYGHQEGAVKGYNPTKPGRPSHNYHSYMIANLRMILDVEVMAGNESSSNKTIPYLFALLDELPIGKRPTFVRGDCNFGTDAVMSECEVRQQPYLFKLKQTTNIKGFISKKMLEDEWENAGQGWYGCEGDLKLMGWKQSRRVIILRRKLKKEFGVLDKKAVSGQIEFNFATVNGDVEAFEYAALVTNSTDEIVTVAAHYRDRADSENNFDELKNQWGWCGFTTQDLHRCRLMARMIALIYNWWLIFARLIEPSKHLEAKTSRPLMLHAVGKVIEHAGQTIIQVSSSHAKFKKIQAALASTSAFFKTLRSSAEQLDIAERMRRVLRRAFRKFFDAMRHHPPNLLPAPA